MSEENVEVVGRALQSAQAALERGDPDAAIDPAVTAVDVEWVLPAEAFEGRTVWSGREQFAEFMRVWNEQFDHLSFHVIRLIDVGDDRVVALIHQSATGKESGVPVEWENGLIYQLKDGLIVRVSNYLTHADALEAAGLQE